MDRENRFIDRLKKNKLRVTEARKAVFQILSESEKSLSVQSVFSKIQKASGIKTDRVSVYRNLSLFSQLGLVHRFQDGKYSLCRHEHHDGHDHLHVIATCNDCGNTFEVDSHNEAMCEAVNKLTGLMGSMKSFSGLPFQGTCKDCKH